jgi:hypothetical protein
MEDSHLSSTAAFAGAFILAWLCLAWTARRLSEAAREDRDAD